MLNRKISNYIYYGVVAFVILLIFIIRVIAVGTIDGKIKALEKENVTLQSDITELNIIVQDNNTVQSSLIYDLNKNMPSIYSSETLSNKIYSKLERLGISEAGEFARKISINETASVSNIEELAAYASYGIVQVQISFTSNDPDDVYNFLNSMNDDDQLFILSNVSYSIPEADEYITVSLSYYAFYNDTIG